MLRTKLVVVAVVAGLLSACSAGHHRDAVRDDPGERISAGVVEREIRVGMGADEVAAVLGAPNLVTTDSQRRQTWVYDKIATERVDSSSRLGVFTLLVNPSQSASASRTSQRTLTVIVKFDESDRVRDFSYRQSSF